MKSFIWSAALWIFLFISCDRELSVSQPDPPPPEGSFIIASQPEGYDIYIDNRITGDKTPYKFHYLQEHDYEIELKHPWYIDTAINITITDEVDSHFVNLENHSNFRGTIFCRSYPMGANIFLDDSLIEEKTPTEITNLYPGKHKIKYELLGHRGEEFETLVRSNDSSVVSTTLEDTTIWMTYTTENCDMVADDLNAIYINYDSYLIKQLWVGSSTAGLLRFKNAKWDFYNKSNTPTEQDYVGYIKEDQQGNLCAVSARAVYKFKDSEFIGTFPENGNPVLNVGFVSHYDEFWKLKNYSYYITPADGLIKVDKDEITYLTPGNSPMLHAALSSIDGYKNYLAVGLVKERLGFFVIKHSPNGDEWTNFNYSILDSAAFLYQRINYIKAIRREGTTKVYAAQYGLGIYIVHDIENKIVEWLPLPTTVKSIKFEDEYMWVCTFDGLYKFLDNQIVEHYTMANAGLPSDVITDIWFDDNRDIYITTPKGLCRYKRDNDD